MEKIKSMFLGMYRYIYYKLIVPMKRERKNPKYIARATAVGIFCGFTPMFWQMNIVLVIWVIARFFKIHFSLAIGFAWTWISNTFTNIPLFYLYYLTGSFLMGKEIGGYNSFMAYFDNGIMGGLKSMIVDYGPAILLGSTVYMVAGAVIGYFLSYWFAVKALRKLEERRMNRVISDKSMYNNGTVY